MLVTAALPRPLWAQNAPAPPEVPPEPEPKPRFRESARSFRRDLLLGAALLGATPGILPSVAGRAVGAVVGGLGLLSGYGEVREGMRFGDIHQVLDGALHMGISVSMLAVAAVSSPLAGAFLSTGGYSLMTGKALYDHPGEVMDILVQQPFKLVHDAGMSVWQEIRPNPHEEKEAPRT